MKHRGIKKTGVENVGNWSLKSFDFIYKKYQKKSYARPMKYDFLEELRFALNLLYTKSVKLRGGHYGSSLECRDRFLAFGWVENESESGRGKSVEI